MIQKQCAGIDSTNDQLMKTQATNLEKSAIDKVLSKLVDHTVSNEKISAGLDSFRLMTKEPGVD